MSKKNEVIIAGLNHQSSDCNGTSKLMTNNEKCKKCQTIGLGIFHKKGEIYMCENHKMINNEKWDIPISEFNLAEALKKSSRFHEPFKTQELLRLYAEHIQDDARRFISSSIKKAAQAERDRIIKEIEDYVDHELSFGYDQRLRNVKVFVVDLLASIEEEK